MKTLPSFLLIALCAGCASTTSPFVQNDIRIVPPVTQLGYDGATQTRTIALFNEGGTRWIKMRDAEGKQFDVYIDHRIGSTTPGAIYLLAYPDKSNSVRVLNEREFKRRVAFVE